MVWFAKSKVLFCITFNEEKQENIHNFSKSIINFFDGHLVLAYNKYAFCYCLPAGISQTTKGT